MQPESSSIVSVACPSQVHHLETTAAYHLPKSYRDHLLTIDRGEWDRSYLVYSAYDLEHGTHFGNRLEDCKTYSWFARNSVTGKVRVISNSCRLRWCPFCARSRYVEIRAELLKWINTLRRPKFLTLTYLHSDASIFEQVTSLYAAFRKLRQHKVIRQAVRGGVWFFQIKVSKKSGEYHPHLHIVLDSDYVSKFTISKQWLETTGNSYIIDIRAVESPDKVADYVARYAARPACLCDFTPEQGVEVFSLLHRRRLCGKFGTGCKVFLGHKKIEDFSQWCRIGSWTQIVNMTVRADCCRRIIDAWLNDTCIQDSDCPDFSMLEVQRKHLGDVSSLDIDSFFHKYEGFG